MEFNEKDIERYIVENPDCVDCDGIVGTQIAVGTGITDVIGFRMEPGEIVAFCVIEIKKDKVTCNDVGQLFKYLFALRKASRKPGEHFWLEGALVGSDFEIEAMMLADELEIAYYVYTASLAVETDRRQINPLQDWLTKTQIDSLEKAVGKLRNTSQGTTTPSKTEDSEEAAHVGDGQNAPQAD